MRALLAVVGARLVPCRVLRLLGRDVAGGLFLGGVELLDHIAGLLTLLIARIYIIFIRYTSVVGLFIGL